MDKISVKVYAEDSDEFVIRKADPETWYMWLLPAPRRILGHSSSEEQEEVRKTVLPKIEAYNQLIDNAFSVPGFREFFVAHNHAVSKDNVCKEFGADVAEKLFMLENNGFDNQFRINGNVFFDSDAEYCAEFQAEGKQFSFFLSDYSYDAYNKNGMIYFLDHSNCKAQFAYGLCSQFAQDISPFPELPWGGEYAGCY